MNYTDILDHISNSIFYFNQDHTAKLNELINSPSMIKIHQRNLFIGAHKRLGTDYPGVFKHLEQNNFKFLLRKYLLEKKIASFDINVFSEQFCEYLSEIKSLHQDHHLESLAQLDFMYSFNKLEEVTVYKNTFRYWSSLIAEKPIKEFQINLTQFETVRVIEINGEKSLILKKD